MKPWAKWTAKTVLVTTGFAAAGGGFAGVALAGTGGSNPGILDGNQVSVPVSVPVDVCGNAAAVLGIATAGCQGGAEVITRHGPAGRAHDPRTGNTVQIPIKIGVNACGNAIGGGKAGCQGGVDLPGGGQAGSGGTIRHAGLSAANPSVGGGLLSGNRVHVPVSVPANVCGNAVAVLGGSNAGCVGGATVNGQDPLSTLQLAGLGTLPGLASLPTLAGLTEPALHGLDGGTAQLPANTLSAFTSSVDAGGMSSNSFVTLAIGSLLAGATALKLAGRRSRAGKTGNGEASA
jgi:hypothetical protein